MSDTIPTPRFAHQRLDAYRVAVELFREVEQVAAEADDIGDRDCAPGIVAWVVGCLDRCD